MTGSYVVILAVVLGVGAPFLVATAIYLWQRRSDRASRARREGRGHGSGDDGGATGFAIDPGSRSRGDDGDGSGGGGDGGSGD
jgi:hypothetical protein